MRRRRCCAGHDGRRDVAAHDQTEGDHHDREVDNDIVVVVDQHD
jgi:hypothetical protein